MVPVLNLLQLRPDIFLLHQLVDLLFLPVDYFLVYFGLLYTVDQRRVIVVLVSYNFLHRPANIKHYQQNRILFLALHSAGFFHDAHVISGKFELAPLNDVFMLAKGTYPHDVFLILLALIDDIFELCGVGLDLLVVVDRGFILDGEHHFAGFAVVEMGGFFVFFHLCQLQFDSGVYLFLVVLFLLGAWHVIEINQNVASYRVHRHPSIYFGYYNEGMVRIAS